MKVSGAPAAAVLRERTAQFRLVARPRRRPRRRRGRVPLPRGRRQGRAGAETDRASDAGGGVQAGMSRGRAGVRWRRGGE